MQTREAIEKVLVLYHFPQAQSFSLALIVLVPITPTLSQRTQKWKKTQVRIGLAALLELFFK